MPELLLELLSEEIPARMQARAAADLERLVCDKLREAGLAFDGARSFATPRRLALVVEGLPDAQPDTTVERKGPRFGAPDKAVEGFLRSLGLGPGDRDKLERRETAKGETYFAVEHRKGRAAAEVLAELLPAAVTALPWPKSMRWGRHAQRWVRPLRRVLCLFDGAVVAFAVGPVESGDATAGHRFLAPEPFAVTGFADYRDRLRDAYVMLDADERRRVIEQDAARLAEAEGLRVKADAALVAENAGLVEWPVVLIGRIDPEFMAVPPEVLTTAMGHHQKYFALEESEGNLAPRFLLVANTLAGDGGKRIVAGNERVLRARLADAKFFWDQDRKRSLESRVADLDGVVFHARLGTLGDKTKRIAALAAEIASLIPGADVERARAAARLAKADLTTDMVGEFPELQGVMGRYYALADGHPAAVADAIADHYSPLGPNDRCPDTPVSVAVALADKIYSLVGFFALRETPSGSKDPFALRRAALGAIRIILENQLRFSLSQIFTAAWTLLPQDVRDGSLETAQSAISRKIDPDRPPESPESIFSRALLDFFENRLKVHLREQGVRHDLISAVFALGGEDDLVRLLARVEALDEFLRSEDGEHLLTAYRRAANIVRIEEKRDGVSYDGAEVDPELLREADEKAVGERLSEVEGLAQAALAREEFANAMAAMATLRQPVDAFFDNVTVNCDEPDLRRNRLLLLGQIRATLDRVADFSRIEG